jgi:hypothetical protein
MLERIKKHLPDVPPETTNFGIALAIGTAAIAILVCFPIVALVGFLVLAAAGVCVVASDRGKGRSTEAFPNPCQHPVFRAGAYAAWVETTHDHASTHFQDMVSQDQSASGLER